MEVRRRILLAWLTFVGFTAWLCIGLSAWLEPTPGLRAMAWMFGGVFASISTCRVIPDLKLRDVALATLFGQLVATSIGKMHIAPDLLAAIFFAELGAVIGWLKARYREPARWPVLVIASGAITLGVTAPFLGIAYFSGLEPATPVLLGMLLGQIVVMLVVPDIRWWHCALGSTISCTMATAALSKDYANPVLIGIAGSAFVFGAVCGAVGRAARQESAESLPRARIIRD